MIMMMMVRGAEEPEKALPREPEDKTREDEKEELGSSSSSSSGEDFQSYLPSLM